MCVSMYDQTYMPQRSILKGEEETRALAQVLIQCICVYIYFKEREKEGENFSDISTQICLDSNREKEGMNLRFGWGIFPTPPSLLLISPTPPCDQQPYTNLGFKGNVCVLILVLY